MFELTAPAAPATTVVKPAEIREWAKAQGIAVGARGRIPAEIVEKFRAATGR